MGKRTASTMKITAIALVVLGAGLGYWGYQISGSVGSIITHAITGSDTNKVMTLYISGAVSFVVGAYLFINNKS